jgi:exonuclease SbcC
MLRNFLPYRAPDDIRFEGIHLACLTGSNGAGKSSILDAITWALWGSARTKRDEDLIHQGQNDMQVQLDFEQEGIMYRVLRRRSRAKRTSTGTLDLFVLNGDGQPQLISEPNMRATQEKINRLLRLDYETFIHSAFLQQGKADAFTTQPPGKRKQILADILGLAQWEIYEDRVKEHLKQLEVQLNTTEQRLKEIDQELQRRPALLRDQADATRIHGEAREALQTAQTLLDAIKDAPSKLKASQEKKGDLERRRRDYGRDLESIKDQIARHEKQIADYGTIIAMRQEIEDGYTALQSARDTDQSLNAKLTDLMNLDKRRAELNAQLSAARARLESEVSSLRRNIAELEGLLAVSHGDDLESVQEEITALRAQEAKRDDLHQTETQLREERARLDQALKNLEEIGKELRERLDKLNSTDSALCPLCGQPLDATHRTDLITQLGAEVEQYRVDYRQHKDRITEIDKLVKTGKTALTALESQLKQLPMLLERGGKLQAQIDAAEQAALRLTEEQERLVIVRGELDLNQFAPDVREALAALDLEETSLAYDKSTHDQTRRSLDEFKRYEQLQTRLAIALESLPTLEDAIAGARLREERLQAAIGEIDEELTQVEITIAGLIVQVKEYQQREEEVRQQHTRERTAYERLVNIQQSLEALEAQAQRRIQLEQRRETMRREESLYKELKLAFGKNGIPAMIIETAIPELEQTANDLLTRMTDGRMSLRLNTQKEKITGGVAETLDIEIADELGTRNYELYSGGEAFRINFAIRVALSQLLARRAGAHLRTLFIDEGFGTQDDEGRNKLVEAITAIQDEFDLILVITHIDDLRDSFPVHIMVDKTSNGSRVSIR